MPRRKFGYLRQLPSGRWQTGDPRLDGRRPTSSKTLGNAIDAERWLVSTQRPSSWDEATEDFGEPARVSRLAVLVDIKGLLSPKVGSDRLVRCMCTYLSKQVADTYSVEHVTRAACQRRVDRLCREVQTLPWPPESVKGRGYNVTSTDPEYAIVPGRCSSPAHDRENLALGRRGSW